MKQYYYADGDQQKGPFSFEELRSKNISKDTYVWYEGLADWMPAGDLAELSALFQATTSFAPPPPQQPNVQANNPPPANQGGYNQPANQPMGGYQTRRNTPSGQKPKTWLVESILATVLCCIPTGIAAIVFAAKVDTKWNQGDIAAAEKASADAKLWTLISVGLGLVVGVIYFLIGLSGGL